MRFVFPGKHYTGNAFIFLINLKARIRIIHVLLYT
jgi:hypothetical protein